jgi:hypothetical protein
MSFLVWWIKFPLEFGEWFTRAVRAEHPAIMQAVWLTRHHAVMPHAELPAVPAGYERPQPPNKSMHPTAISVFIHCAAPFSPWIPPLAAPNPTAATRDPAPAATAGHRGRCGGGRGLCRCAGRCGAFRRGQSRASARSAIPNRRRAASARGARRARSRRLRGLARRSRLVQRAAALTLNLHKRGAHATELRGHALPQRRQRVHRQLMPMPADGGAQRI